MAALTTFHQAYRILRISWHWDFTKLIPTIPFQVSYLLVTAATCRQIIKIRYLLRKIAKWNFKLRVWKWTVDYNWQPEIESLKED